MKNTSETNFKILLILFFGLFNSVFMETADEDFCDASDEALAQWYGQVYNFVKTNQNITQQTTNMQAKLEKNMQEMYNKLVEKLEIQFVQQEKKMQETQAKIEDSIQEMYKKMEEILKSQLLQQEHRIILEIHNKLEDNLKKQPLQEEHRMQEMYNKLELNLTTQHRMQEMYNKLESNLTRLLQTENLEKLENLVGINDIVIQRRMDGSVDFQRTWQEYREGFGNKSGEFFIGFDILHNLTSSRRYELIVMENWENDRRHVKYDNFVIGSEAEKYALKSLGEYSGTAGDALDYHLGQSFTTKDQDNGEFKGVNCAVDCMGAWWYKDCYAAGSNLNGLYLKGERAVHGVTWYNFNDNYDSLKFVEMKLHPH